MLYLFYPRYTSIHSTYFFLHTSFSLLPVSMCACTTTTTSIFSAVHHTIGYCITLQYNHHSTDGHRVYAVRRWPNPVCSESSRPREALYWVRTIPTPSSSPLLLSFPLISSFSLSPLSSVLVDTGNVCWIGWAGFHVTTVLAGELVRTWLDVGF